MFILESIGERLKWFRIDKNLKLEEVNEGTSVPIATLSRMENNQGRPYSDTVISLANFYKASLEWLFRGSGQPYLGTQANLDPEHQDLIKAFGFLSQDNQHALKTYMAFLLSHNNLDALGEALNKPRAPVSPPASATIKEDKSVYLPLLGVAAAGTPIMTEELLEGFVPVPATKIKRNNYLIKARGESMIEAGINDGDLVIINPQPMVENGEIALARIDGEVTIKKFYKFDFEIRLRPANSSMNDIVIHDLAKLIILGKIIGIVPAEEANRKMQYEFDGPNG